MLTLALGIGATTAIFTVVNAVLLRPLPYPHPDELVYVQEILDKYGAASVAGVSEFAAWRDQSRTLNPVAAYTDSWFNLTGGGDPERITAGLATSAFFSLLGVRPLTGRLFLPEEDRPGGPPVVILSEALWRRRYGGDVSVVGRSVTLDGKVYTVVGVLPRPFVIPADSKIDYALWVPLIANETGAGPMGVVRVIGRLKPGMSLEAARSDLNAILRSTRAGGPEGWVKSVRSQPGKSKLRRNPGFPCCCSWEQWAFCSLSPVSMSPTCCSPAPQRGTKRWRYGWRWAQGEEESSGSFSRRAGCWPCWAELLGLALARSAQGPAGHIYFFQPPDAGTHQSRLSCPGLLLGLGRGHRLGLWPGPCASGVRDFAE